MTSTAVVKKLKENGDDFEWYPTTVEIVKRLSIELKSRYNPPRNILDIGCGKGDFCDKLKALELAAPVHFYGIEKSRTLINKMPDYITLLGTDFYEQTLIDKKMDLVFCNPPYSQYEDWAARIITEANACKIALVIPDRWEASEAINQAIKARVCEYEILGSYSFENAERKARANVHLILFDMETRHAKDAFSVWYDNTFEINLDKTAPNEKQHKEEIRNELVQTENVADQLLRFYQADMDKLFSNYKALEDMDADILKELNVDITMLKESLKTKMAGLKRIYWDLLFNRYNKITDRLTSYSRDKFIGKMTAHNTIDFTMDNIFAITMWVIKNSNTTYQDQLKHYYMELADPDSIQQYKSNKRFNEDDWRYIKEHWHNVEKKNFMFDYRIVVKLGGSQFSVNSYTYRNRHHDLLCDTIKIAQNLGFKIDNVMQDSPYYSQEAINEWKNKTLYYKNGKQFADVKCYQNGNIHFRFDREFMQRLNVEASRLFGWIHDKEEAAEELGLKPDEVSRAWHSSYAVLESPKQLLIGE